VSRPGEITERPPPTAEELAEFERVRDALAIHQGVSSGMIEWIRRECSVCKFGGGDVPGLEGHVPPLHGSPVTALINETSIVVDVLNVACAVCVIVSDPTLAGHEGLERAREMVRVWRSRPATYAFLRHILLQRGWWGLLVHGSELETINEDCKKQAEHTGAFGDVGDWNERDARALLTRDWKDWSVSDGDALKVVDMIKSAAPATRADLIMQLASMGKLDRLCENLPWRAVKQMWDEIDDPDARALLGPHWAGKGGGESMSRIYDRNIDEAISNHQYQDAWNLVLLDKFHSMATFGFKDAHDQAYEAREGGWISDDAYHSTSGKAVARSAALMAVTGITGGAAGAWGEGAALGMGAGRTTAQIIGGGIGGAASGVAGQFTGDIFDVTFMGADDFSSPGEYAKAGGLGLATGAVTAGMQAGGAKYLPDSAKTMSQLYATRYPHLDNVLTRFRNSGVRSGLKVRVTAQELRALAAAGLIDGTSLDAHLQRIEQVYSNPRVDVDDVNLTRIMPASDVEKYYGSIDRRSGNVEVTNPEPTVASYVGVTEDMPVGAMNSDQSVRETMGIDGSASWYDRYKVAYDPLYQLTFKTRVELDVPLPQDNAQYAGYATLGGQDPMTSHRPGVGRTSGGVREGILPVGAPIEIIEIVPVGERHALGNYPAPPEGGVLKSPPRSVRNLSAPVAGAAGGFVDGFDVDPGLDLGSVDDDYDDYDARVD
jgi:hypothetical protein